MSRYDRRSIHKTGLDTEKLVRMLVKAAGAELTTYYYYTILRVNFIGPCSGDLKEITEDARLEDRQHFETLVPRIYELGGALPRDMRVFHDGAACPPAYLPASRNQTEMLKVLLDAERCAVGVYREICSYTLGRDPRTYDMALAILHEEIEHEGWFEELLGYGPSGHFRRRYPGEGPYTAKFRHIERQ